MSRLSSKRVQARVGPACLEATLAGGWWGRRELATTTQDWAPALVASPAAANELGERWPAACAEACAAFADAGTLRGAALEIELGDAFVHFDVAEGRFAAQSPQQLQAAAAACAAEMLGPGHAVRWQLQPDERHLLLCALPQTLVAAFASGATDQGLVLRRLHPSFERGWNRHRRELGRGAAVFAQQSPGQTIAALVRDGSIQALSAEAGGSAAALDAQVERLLASLGVPPQELAGFIADGPATELRGLSPRWKTADRAAVAP